MDEKGTFWHWTSEESFDIISKKKRLLGLTEGRVYLSNSDKRTSSIWKHKNYKIVLEIDSKKELAFKHPPSPWGLIKFRQWVTPVGTNITWQNATIDKQAKTMTVHDPVLEYQSGKPLYLGRIRHYGRILGMDIVLTFYILWAFIFALSAVYCTNLNEWLMPSSTMSLILFFMPFAITILGLILWFPLQYAINRYVANSYP